jgi:hypothetical protein
VTGVNLRLASLARRDRTSLLGGFWVAQMDAPLPKWVKSAALTTGRSLPVCPYQQTFLVFAGLSQRCQFLTGRRMVRLVCCALRFGILCILAVLSSLI